jgi:hypothetical protein
MKFKLLAYGGTWLAALIATDPSFGLWALVYMFPLGLFAFFFPDQRQIGGWSVIFGVAAIYAVHAISFFRARTTRSSLILLGLLMILLICNVAGCRAMNHPH